MALVGIAALVDHYLEKNPVQLGNIENTGSEKQNNTGTIEFVSQLNLPGAKIEVQKPGFRKLQSWLYCHFIQKHHQLLSHHFLKSEVLPSLQSPVLRCYRPAYENYFFSDPDDDPLVS
ncbi:MAG: hypothetical protein CSA36_06805 [Draconibacterium sp.]|nr:MAG: hypothetical protein CSA36_06805 [Draconibacterium sp.]